MTELFRATSLRRGAGVPLLLALGLSACGVTVQRPGAEDEQWMSKAEFRAYAETVFRRQNALQSRLLFLLPELEHSDPARYQRLVAAEEELIEACRPLVELALQRRRGLEIGFLQRIHLPPKITACDRETQRIERLLAQ